MIGHAIKETEIATSLSHCTLETSKPLYRSSLILFCYLRNPRKRFMAAQVEIKKFLQQVFNRKIWQIGHIFNICNKNFIQS